MAKYCRFCGTQISESAAFCRRCGKPVKRQDVVQPKPAPLQRTGDPLPSAEIQPKITSYAGSEKITDSQTASEVMAENKTVPQTKRNGLNMTLILAIIDTALAVWIILSYLSA